MYSLFNFILFCSKSHTFVWRINLLFESGCHNLSEHASTATRKSRFSFKTSQEIISHIYKIKCLRSPYELKTTLLNNQKKGIVFCNGLENSRMFVKVELWLKDVILLTFLICQFHHSGYQKKTSNFFKSPIFR